MKNAKLVWIWILAAALLLSACRTPAPEATATDSPDLVFTAAAQTAGAIMTEAALLTPSPTTAPTETPAPPTETTAPTAAVTTAVATVAGAVATTAVPPAGSTGGDSIIFVSDVTVEDGTDFDPGETFTKTWQVKNDGSTTWTTGYELVYVEGNQMDGPDSVPIPNEVAAEGTVNISVELTAPSTAGDHIGYWRMRNANGVLFGNPIWVDIDVVGSGTEAASATSGPSPTPGGNTPTTAAGSGTVTGVSVSLDDPTGEGECPHTFNVTAQFALAQASNVAYQLEAGSETAGFEIDLPDPVNNSLAAGSHQLTFTLTFEDDIDGWVRFHITSPQDVRSDQVNFSLQCQ